MTQKTWGFLLSSAALSFSLALIENPAHAAGEDVTRGLSGGGSSAGDSMGGGSGTGKTALKIEEEKVSRNKVSGSEQVDEVLTNNGLRAYSGSISRWSVASSFTYSGGSLNSPLSEDRPNITEESGTITKSLLAGQISAKYNIDAKNSLLAGIGVRWIAPLSTSGPHDYNGSAFDTDNPYLQWQYIYQLGGIQTVLQVQSMVFTNANLLAEGYVASLNVDQEMMYEIGHSRLSVGASMWVQGSAFNKTGPIGQPGTESYMEDVRTDQADYAFGLFPVIEYQFNDRFNFRTMAGLWSFEHIRAEASGNTYRWDKVYQSVGLGCSVTRDIFLYPNVQFLPDNNRASLTSVALNATINLF